MRVGVDGHGYIPHVSVETQVTLIAVAGVPVYGEAIVEPPVRGDCGHGRVGAVVFNHTGVARAAGLPEVEWEVKTQIRRRVLRVTTEPVDAQRLHGRPIGGRAEKRPRERCGTVTCRLEREPDYPIVRNRE